ncbi:general stress protein [Gloeothece verrucosa]|nr:general stress protein [Gloeothece verrucosa]
MERPPLNANPQTGGIHQRAVGVFQKSEDLENAIRGLKDAGFNMDNVSLIARNPKEVEKAQDMTGNEAKEGAAAGATAGTVLGGVGGLLVGLGVLLVPGAGPFLAAGTLATTLAGAGIGAAAGGIVGGLVGLGIPEERAQAYSDRIEAGDYLIMISGTQDQIRQATEILRNYSIQDFEIYRESNSNLL